MGRGQAADDSRGTRHRQLRHDQPDPEAVGACCRTVRRVSHSHRRTGNITNLTTCLPIENILWVDMNYRISLLILFIFKSS